MTGNVALVPIGLILAALTGVSSGNTARCVPRDLSWLQADTAGWVIAVASGDSAVAESRGQRRVYGQLATIERASDERLVGRRGLFVFWELGAMCEPEPRDRALRQQSGDRFFIGGGHHEVRGVSTFDVTAFTPEYDESWLRRDSLGSWLTVDEYAAFYSAMPRQREYFDDPRAAARRVRAWAQSNPLVASRRPASDALWMMERDHVLYADEWRETGRWSRDSLFQEPGLLVRPGLQLVYAGPTEQRWIIDSVVRSTIFGAECVRMRMRLAPTAQPTTRHFCTRDGILLTVDARTGVLRETRPLLPGRRLTTRQGSTVSLFETDSLQVVAAGGSAVEVIGTIVTTRDSTGRIVRRLRELFAPSLLTATEGTFEVPDASQPGGWRITSRFYLREIR